MHALKFLPLFTCKQKVGYVHCFHPTTILQILYEILIILLIYRKCYRVFNKKTFYIDKITDTILAAPWQLFEVFIKVSFVLLLGYLFIIHKFIFRCQQHFDNKVFIRAKISVIKEILYISLMTFWHEYYRLDLVNEAKS